METQRQRIGSARRLLHRTQGSRHGPVTRLMSPSDLGRVAKPFVFLDLVDTGADQFEGFGLHPHSGIATITFFFEGAVTFEDTNGASGKLRAGALEWMQAGRGAWHGGGFGDEGRSRGFQLWIALPPERELGEPESVYLAPGDIPHAGPARVLLGEYGGVVAPITPPSALVYLALTLKAGEQWTFQPPAGQTVCWIAVGAGSLDIDSGEKVAAGEMIVLEPGSGSLVLTATDDCEFVLGSAAPHDHGLVLGRYSVHTSRAALAAGEMQIELIRQRLVAQGRLPALAR